MVCVSSVFEVGCLLQVQERVEGAGASDPPSYRVPMKGLEAICYFVFVESNTKAVSRHSLGGSSTVHPGTPTRVLQEYSCKRLNAPCIVPIFAVQ